MDVMDKALEGARPAAQAAPDGAPLPNAEDAGPDAAPTAGEGGEAQGVSVVDKLASIAVASPEKLARRKKWRFWKHKDVNEGERSFASGLNGYKLIWVFIIGCVAGVLIETLWVAVTRPDKVWVRRSGMLYGPFNQVYGFAAVLFTIVLYRFRKLNAFFIFLGSAFIGGLFEYVVNWVQQLWFGSVSWEYSHLPGNIGGRTNIFYSLGWGVLGLLFIVHLWPWLSEMIERIPNKIKFKRPKAGKAFVITGKTLTIVFAVALALNLALSAAAVYRTGRRHEGVPANWFGAHILDSLYPDEVMAEKYPSLWFVDRFAADNSDLWDEDTAAAENGDGGTADGAPEDDPGVSSAPSGG